MHGQSPLFDGGASGDNALVQVGVGNGKSLSRAQKTFNRLIGRIGDQRRRLAEWQAFAQSFGSRVAADLAPLERRIGEQRRALLRCLDAAHDGGKLTRREQSKVARIICERAVETLEREDDPALIVLHDKYSDVSHEDLRQGRIRALKAMTEASLGMSFDDGEIRTPGDLVDAVHRQIGEGSRRETSRDPGSTRNSDRLGGGGYDNRERRDRDDRYDRHDQHDQHGQRDRPTSARASARIERERAAVEGATRSVREVYRKLASALHPDRESDPAERDRKTELMQRVNQAYEARDLLQLLALQIQVEQIDLTQLAALGDDRIAHYNRVLREQSAELDQEIQDLMEPFATGLGGNPDRDLTPAIVIGAFQEDVAHLRRESAWMAKQLELFRDLRMLKAWLKTQNVSRGSSAGPSDELESLVTAMVEGIGFASDPPGRSGGRRKRR